VIFPWPKSSRDPADLFFFVDPENPGIVISEGFYTTEFMLVNRKFDLASSPIKSMLLSIFGGGRSMEMAF
jgi:hypothetical protein